MNTTTVMEAVPLVVENLALSFGGNQVLHKATMPAAAIDRARAITFAPD